VFDVVENVVEHDVFRQKCIGYFHGQGAINFIQFTNSAIWQIPPADFWLSFRQVKHS
jgi:hypothetical protein